MTGDSGGLPRGLALVRELNALLAELHDGETMFPVTIDDQHRSVIVDVTGPSL